MPITYMRHIKHGVIPCSSTLEVEWNKKNGWEVDYSYGKPKPDEPKLIQTQEEVKAERTPAQRYEDKFGHPPHHRMKLETIEQKLKE